jgi:hypothetical protein
MRFFCLFLCAAAGFFVAVIHGSAAEPRSDEAQLFAEAQATSDGIDRLQQRQHVITTATRSDVYQALDRARQIVSDDPASAESNLKLMLFSVDEMADLNSDVKQQLIDKLRSAIRQTATIKVEKDERDRTREEAIAQQLSRRRVVEDQTRTEQKVSALMERLTSLMNEGRYREAEEQIAPEALILSPGNAAITAASMTAYHAGIQEEFTAIAEQRSKAQSRTYVQVEAAAIPFKGDPPIAYPVAEVWEDLTQRRTRAYVDLQSRGKNESAILEQLDQSTRMDFEQMPLGEVADYLSEYHGITIMLDQRALDEIGIGSDTPVSARVKGISLRSGLRLMLKGIDPTLTYMVKNEVLQLTTREEVENHLTTRNYPVADLVLPIQDLRFVGSGGFSGGAAASGFGAGAFGGGQMQQQGGFNQDPFQNFNNGPGLFDDGGNNNNFNF